ncbi:helix-turn-helix transcriptional regulator [Chromohalobacter sp. HP20-39]|uniref:helix-turn-helix transcriptional regulator n=1 Tax=Chromohalobacter sp. HP20-39 TaxID=3079306 RepID=UPI00294AB387|nr:AlpA family phage regulatory protein [Chromohalobacter sp. HP20-39]MDV6319588.1 AlpA family phage regulatory protein [Chromohalobacter sp. HP20-39]
MNENERVEEQTTVRLMRWPEVEEITGLSRSTLANMAANGRFPKPVQVSAHITAFLSTEVAAWFQELKARRVHYQGAGAWKRHGASAQQSATPI